MFHDLPGKQGKRLVDGLIIRLGAVVKTIVIRIASFERRDRGSGLFICTLVAIKRAI